MVAISLVVNNRSGELPKHGRGDPGGRHYVLIFGGLDVKLEVYRKVFSKLVSRLNNEADNAKIFTKLASQGLLDCVEMEKIRKQPCIEAIKITLLLSTFTCRSSDEILEFLTILCNFEEIINTAHVIRSTFVDEFPNAVQQITKRKAFKFLFNQVVVTTTDNQDAVGFNTSSQHLARNPVSDVIEIYGCKQRKISNCSPEHEYPPIKMVSQKQVENDKVPGPVKLFHWFVIYGARIMPALPLEENSEKYTAIYGEKTVSSFQVVWARLSSCMGNQTVSYNNARLHLQLSASTAETIKICQSNDSSHKCDDNNKALSITSKLGRDWVGLFLPEYENLLATPQLQGQTPETDDGCRESSDEDGDNESVYLTCSSVSSLETFEAVDTHVQSIPQMTEITYTRRSLHNVSLAFLLIMVLCMGLIFLKNMLDVYAYNPNILHVSSPVETVKISDPPQNMEKHFVEEEAPSTTFVTIQSYTDYIEFLHNANTDSVYVVALRIEHQVTWKFDFGQVGISALFVEGAVPFDVIYKLLKQSSKLNLLSLNNSGQHLCEQQAYFDKETELPISSSVAKLEIVQFGNECTGLLKQLNSKLRFSNLKDMELIDGHFNSENVHFISSILKKVSKTLTGIKWLGATFGDAVFAQDKPGPLLHVDTAVFDVGSAWTYNPLRVFGRFFHLTLPNLEHISIIKSPIQLNYLQAVFKCKHLKSLDVEVEVAKEHSNFSVTFLRDNFTSLQSATLNLNFHECAAEAGDGETCTSNSIVGIKSLPLTLMKRLKITSNCKLYTGLGK